MTKSFLLAGMAALLFLVSCKMDWMEGKRVNARDFSIAGDHFQLDGKPFQILSAEMHYPRIPRHYWRLRMRAAKAMGLNAITTYVFWNMHEAKRGQFDFTGNSDIAEFIREAQEEGLWVILRPGPYICAEWDLGGLPSWLLKDKDLKLRTTDPKFLAAVGSWFKRLGQELAGLQVQNGGPILAVQVENEYGSFGEDHAYMKAIQSLLLESGFNRGVHFTADDPSNLEEGSIPGVLTGVNFGGGNATNAFKQLQDFNDSTPRFASEYWVGWFDTWGKPHNHSALPKHLVDLKWMLKEKISISFYMFHGGSNFGWMAGANLDEGNYMPFVTSYDYDAPLSESGSPTPKYEAFRDLINQENGGKLPKFPKLPAPMAIDRFETDGAVSLWDILPMPILSDSLLSMEDLDQAYGYILYRTRIPTAGLGSLALDGLNDYAQIYIDGSLVGTLDRRLRQNSLSLNVAKAGAQLDILVLNSGRVNYSEAIQGERKGITGSVTWLGRALQQWQIFSLPMDNTVSLPFSKQACVGPCFYRAKIQVETPSDTFLDVSEVHKGMVWLNDRPLGRVWNIGPQKTLYTPGVWLKSGDNELTIFDGFSDGNFLSLQGLPHSNLGTL